MIRWRNLLMQVREGCKERTMPGEGCTVVELYDKMCKDEKLVAEFGWTNKLDNATAIRGALSVMLQQLVNVRQVLGRRVRRKGAQPEYEYFVPTGPIPETDDQQRALRDKHAEMIARDKVETKMAARPRNEMASCLNHGRKFEQALSDAPILACGQYRIEGSNVLVRITPDGSRNWLPGT